MQYVRVVLLDTFDRVVLIHPQIHFHWQLRADLDWRKMRLAAGTFLAVAPVGISAEHGQDGLRPDHAEKLRSWGGRGDRSQNDRGRLLLSEPFDGLTFLSQKMVEYASSGQVLVAKQRVPLSSRKAGWMELAAALLATRLATKFTELRSHLLAGDGGHLLLSGLKQLADVRVAADDERVIC